MFYLRSAYNKVNNFIYGNGEVLENNKKDKQSKKQPSSNYMGYLKSAGKWGLLVVTVGTAAYLTAFKGINGKFKSKEDDRLSEDNFNSFGSDDETNVFSEVNLKFFFRGIKMGNNF